MSNLSIQLSHQVVILTSPRSSSFSIVFNIGYIIVPDVIAQVAGVIGVVYIFGVTVIISIDIVVKIGAPRRNFRWWLLYVIVSNVDFVDVLFVSDFEITVVVLIVGVVVIVLIVVVAIGVIPVLPVVICIVLSLLWPLML